MRPRLTLTSLPLFWALAFSLSSPARAEDGAILIAPQELPAGGRSSLTLTTLNITSHQPVGRPVVLSLLSGESTVSTLHVGATGSDGRIHVPFDVPSVASGDYTIEARIGGIPDSLRLQVPVSSAPAILIETDKPIYKPSQTIQGRVLLVDNGLRPRPGEVDLAFHDAKGIRIDRRSLTANEFGVATFSLRLASEVNFGTWKIRARSESVESIRDVRVENYVLPRFDLGFEFQRRWALVDEAIPGTVNARYFFGRPVEGHAVVTAQRWVGVFEEYARIEGDLSDGRFSFSLPAVGFVAGSPGNSGQGTVTVAVEVTDSTGHKQTTNEVLTITEAPLVLSLVPRSRSLKPGIPAEIVVSSRSPDGEPLNAAVRAQTQFFSIFGAFLGEETDDVTTSGGIGAFQVTAPEDTGYAMIRASADHSGRTARVEIQVGGAYSETASFLALSRTGGEGPVSIGEQVNFLVTSTHGGTVYFEVYGGGRTVLSDFTESDRFAFTVTPEMVPRAHVVAYQIQPSNEVSADSHSLEVELANTIRIQAEFDHAQAKPGDAVQVSLDAGTGHRTLVGLSVVDQSVLALGRSRLHLADVFAELERRFLEPQAEAHEGEGPGGGPVGGGIADVAGGPGFFGPPSSIGALDVLRQAGLKVVTTANLTVPEGQQQDFWRDFDAAEAAPGPPAAGGGGSEPPDTVRVRQYFPETWVWEPLLVTDEQGLASLALTAPDSITGWKLSAVGSSTAGIGFGEAEITVFQDFFVEPSLPVSVTRGEEFPVKVDVFNYLDSDQDVSLSLGSGAAWYELLGEADLTFTVPASSATAVFFPIRPTAIGEHTIELTAVGSSLSDAVQRPLRVIPEGVPVEEVFNGVIEPATDVPLDLTFPPDAVSGSERAFVNLTPSPVAQTMQGVSDLLSMPYGCGEQNMIFLAPDIEILKYLRETGELSPEVRAEAELFVNTGYQRELTFQTDDGGFAAFGGADGSLWLTAFVLSTFSGAREVRDIDETVLGQAAGMLVGRQNPDGSFRTDDFLIHQEMDGGISNVFAMAAYVTRALTEYAQGTNVSAEVSAGIERAANFLANGRSQVNNDAYTLSIVAVALQGAPGFTAASEAVIDRLLELGDSSGVGIHWEPYPVETTGYAAIALLRANGGTGRPEATSAVEWLSTQRNALGGYGNSTQDTVVAIRALFEAARRVRRDLDVDLTLSAGDTALWSVHVDQANFDILHTFEVPQAVLAAEQPVVLSSAGDGNVGYQVVRRYHAPGDVLPPSRDLVIEVEYDSEGIEVDEVLEARVRLLYTGFKEATGMVIADIGVPTGFDAVRSSLDALVEAHTVSRVEVAARKVIFYIDSLRRGEPLAFSFQMRALFPVRAEGPVSEAYEYYDRGIRGFHRMRQVTVLGGAAGPIEFVRGDSNLDESLDLSDAASTLNYLFLGSRPLRCLDAADSNDDGELNITDAIYLLRYLFLGGTVPLEPFPERGTDPTPDRLTCEAGV
jgi:CD109 antigen